MSLLFALPSSISSAGPPEPGTAQAEAPTMFSGRTYLLITLAISVAFGLLVLPASIMRWQHVTLGLGFLMFANPVLAFQVHFGLNYLLRYNNNPIQRWFGRLPLWTNRFLRIVLVMLAVGLYSLSRYAIDRQWGLTIDDNSLGVVLVLSQLITAIGFAFQLAIESVEGSRHLTLENESLKREQLQARYESLKLQLSPHFLFNSLTTLGDLVYDEPSAAVRFIEEMAYVYRYLLQHGERAAVSLREELCFLQSYMYLLQMRFGDGIHTEIALADDIQERLVPPLALQLLVENAVKHNTVRRSQPLLIRIDFLAPGTLQVRNTRAPRLTPEPGSGVGLTNLTNRIRLLNQQKLRVEQTDAEFRVYVPLPA